jgi:3-keto-disaccharide hydrolase
MKQLIAAIASVCCLAAAPAHAEQKWEDLLDQNLSKFDVYLSYPGTQISSVVAGTAPKDLRPIGLNRDDKHVFSVVEQNAQPVLRISGEIYGAAATKQQFDNFHFRAKVKWGEKKWEPRLNEPRDSGVLYFSVGEFGTDYWHSWMEAQEFQIIEGGIGDYWTIATAQCDIRAIKPEGEKFYTFSPTAPWLHFAAEKPGSKGVANFCQHGEHTEIPNDWNQIDLICFNTMCVHIANGTVVMATQKSMHEVNGDIVPLVRGKIQLQSEAAEVYYKDVQIQKITSMPKAYLQYFK